MHTTLIDAVTLSQHLDDPKWVILDCRHDLMNPDAGRDSFAIGHIAGAQFANVDTDLSGAKVGADGKFRGRHPLPERAALIATLRAWGIDDDTQVVAYDAHGGMFAARLWWLLRWLGHDSVAVLDGGFAAWVGEGHPVSAERPRLVTGDFSPRPRAGLLISAMDLAQSRSGKLFDARAPERYRGDVEPIDPVAGHIPGAENLPFADNLRDGRFKSPAELRVRLADALAGTQPEDAAVYCGSGVTACHDVLAFAHAGLPLPKLYAGSWSEWITDPTRPTVRRAGP